ncbi:Major Facilitator Superfamily protein [Methylobacterium sp. UNC300MFChir4.1]|uniref:MFS transporter n=1 Tax=Methylobacterium sp. UNC300MFChir4.1 TaxID=1502747 RepID=UPI0008D03F24|nr:MFS transporter [Methylobacterium sp. UNC300MFChir4.1]SEP35382.1 Major Facilitator Superfamily protein [Methylobacterium sp. UNC300MFChir4.1]
MADASKTRVAIEQASENERARIYRKISLRLIPMIFLCYVLNYIDRVNVRFAKLTFQSDIGLSDASYGFGVGIFYVGYILFEVPSNLLLGRIGARKTLTRIMCLWGLVSCSMAFVTSPATFYLARIHSVRPKLASSRASSSTSPSGSPIACAGG